MLFLFFNTYRMKFIVSAEELQRAIEAVCGVVSQSTSESGEAHERWLKEIYEQSLQGFVNILGPELAAAPEAPVSQWRIFESHLNDYLTGDLRSVNQDIRRRLRDIGIELENAHQTFDKVTTIIRDFLLGIFVDTEVRELKQKCAEILQAHQWQHSVDQAFLRLTAPALHAQYIIFLREQMEALRVHCLSYNLGTHHTVYQQALTLLFDAMADCLQKVQTPPLQPAAVYPAHIFGTAADYSIFCRLHSDFLKRPADFSYLFRLWKQERRVHATDVAFREWYNNWPDATCELNDYFKTWDRVNSPARHRSYLYSFDKASLAC